MDAMNIALDHDVFYDAYEMLKQERNNMMRKLDMHMNELKCMEKIMKRYGKLSKKTQKLHKITSANSVSLSDVVLNKPFVAPHLMEFDTLEEGEIKSTDQVDEGELEKDDIEKEAPPIILRKITKYDFLRALLTLGSGDTADFFSLKQMFSVDHDLASVHKRSHGTMLWNLTSTGFVERPALGEKKRSGLYKITAAGIAAANIDSFIMEL